MSDPNAKIIYLTAGAGGMFCGSCMHDNALSSALKNAGWDVQLVATYTPIRTDEPDVSVDHVLFGGLNVYLQQKIPLFRYLPAVLDRFLDNPNFIRRVTSKAINTDSKTLGALAVSMLQGKDGNQRKEIKQMTKWLKLANPDILIFSNILIGGCIPEIKQQIGQPVLVTLQGDDVFLDSLPDNYRNKCLALIQQVAKHVDGFIVHSEFYRDFISGYLGIPPENFHVTPLGLDTTGFPAAIPRHKIDAPVNKIGFLARLAPEKGLHHLVDGFIELKKRPGTADVKLKIAGWQSPQWQEYNDLQWSKLRQAGLDGEYENLGSIEREQKLEFLSSVDLFSVPTEFLEPKGLYALEAMAAGVPVIAPDHGAFPELIQSTGGGVLFAPGDHVQWADVMWELIQDPDRRQDLARQGHQAVHQHRNPGTMAADAGDVIKQFLTRK